MNLVYLVQAGLALACLVLGAAFAPAQAPSQPKAQSSHALAPLQGTWKIVRWQDKDFDQLPERMQQDFRNLRIVIDGNKMTWTDGKYAQAKTLKVDATKSLKTIDLTWTMKTSTFHDVADAIGGTEKPMPAKKRPAYETITLPGIYKIEGDRLTLAVVDVDRAKVRPTEFRVTQEPPTIVMVLQRVASNPKAGAKP